MWLIISPLSTVPAAALAAGLVACLLFAAVAWRRK